jgi:flagellar basal-body rod protein FlgC
MNSAMSIALSGMQAATRRLDVAARNIANVQSNGALPGVEMPDGSAAPQAYAPQRVDQVEVAGGTEARVSAVSPAYVPQRDPDAPYANADGMVAAPNVDLTSEAAQVMVAKYTFAANAMVLRTGVQMVRSLLDIRV